MSWLTNLLPSVLGGAASYFGQKDANQTNLDIARETNASNAQQVQRLMDFQENMSNTQYQRTVSDMKAAGINPMLASQLGGASSPSGASIPSVTGAPQQSVASGIEKHIHSALDTARLRYDMKVMDESIKNMQETNSQIKSQTALNSALSKSAQADQVLKSNSAKVADINSKLLDSKLYGAKVEEYLDQTTYGAFMRSANRANLPFLGSSARTIKGVGKLLVPKQPRG